MLQLTGQSVFGHDVPAVRYGHHEFVQEDGMGGIVENVISSGTSTPPLSWDPYEFRVYCLDGGIDAVMERHIDLVLPAKIPMRIPRLDRYPGEGSEVLSGWVNIRLNGFSVRNLKVQYYIENYPITHTKVRDLPDGTVQTVETLLDESAVTTQDVSLALMAVVSNGDGTTYQKLIYTFDTGGEIQDAVEFKIPVRFLWEAYMDNRNLVGFYYITLPPNETGVDLNSTSLTETMRSLYFAISQENLSYFIATGGGASRLAFTGTTYARREWKWQEQFITNWNVGLSGTGLQSTDTLQNFLIPA